MCRRRRLLKNRGHRGLRERGAHAACAKAATRLVGRQRILSQGRVSLRPRTGRLYVSGRSRTEAVPSQQVARDGEGRLREQSDSPATLRHRTPTTPVRFRWRARATSSSLRPLAVQGHLTDEPYNVKISGHVTGGAHREFAMASGEMSNDEFPLLIKRTDAMPPYSRPWGPPRCGKCRSQCPSEYARRRRPQSARVERQM